MHIPSMLLISFCLSAPAAAAPQSRPADTPLLLTKADGYHGIWYSNQATGDEYRYKYSGGMATYPSQHLPLAWYVPEVKKTFFVYGGTSRPDNSGKPHVLAMISYYDHASGQVPRPTILMDRATGDAHEDPVLAVEPNGRLWVFLPGHGDRRPAYILRSKRPHDIDAFEIVSRENFSYPEPWFLPDGTLVFLHTRYRQGRRELFCSRWSESGGWSEAQHLAAVDAGHYQVSWRDGQRIATAFNYHPKEGGLNARSNLYYMETRDAGRTWQTVQGKTIELPLKEIANPALAHDYRSEERLVYLVDLNFDAAGKPVVLYVTSRKYVPGPAGGPRSWELARWTGEEWKIGKLAPAGHNYDTGSLYIDDKVWRLVAPTEMGPQPFGGGGEMWLWTSRDEGQSWDKKALTHGSRINHNYARRPVNAQPDFYALWADGHSREPSPSRMYFCTRDGQVFALPEHMDGKQARPQPVK